MNFYISKFYKETFATNIRFFVKFRNSKMSHFINIKPLLLKFWIFTYLNMVFPVVVIVFDFNESSEGVLHGHCLTILMRE
jgi:hypothetical protein